MRILITGGTGFIGSHLCDEPVQRLIVASSMSLYDETLSCATNGAAVVGTRRTPDQLASGEWEREQPARPRAAVALRKVAM